MLLLCSSIILKFSPLLANMLISQNVLCDNIVEKINWEQISPIANTLLQNKSVGHISLCKISSFPLCFFILSHNTEAAFTVDVWDGNEEAVVEVEQ